MQLTTKTVSNIIKGWAILYPSAQRSTAQEAFIAKEFYEELKDHFSEEAFALAASKVKRHCRFFPTIADMYAVREEAVSEINRKAGTSTALPEHTDPNTPEERDAAKKRLALINQAIKNEITFEEAERQMQNLVGYAQE